VQLSPIRQLDEKLSAFRFRYALFSLKCAVALAIPLMLLVIVRPNINDYSGPFLLMLFYFGLPVGLGMAVLSALGYAIGGFFARQLENSPTAHRRWSCVRFGFLALVSAPLTAFCFYWLFRGVTTLETQALARGGLRLITPQSAPFFFWFSLVGWAVFAFGIPCYVYRHAKLLSHRA